VRKMTEKHNKNGFSSQPVKIEVETEGGTWARVGYATCWQDILNTGWRFCGMSGKYAVMKRNGLIRRFRNVVEE